MISAITLFCEDVRNEANGAETFIGVFPQNVTFVGTPPYLMPKLGIVTKINFTPDDVPARLTVKLYDFNKSVIINNVVDSSLIEEAKAGISTTGMGAINATAVAANFPFTGPGILRVEVETDKYTFTSGALNVHFEPPTP